MGVNWWPDFLDQLAGPEWWGQLLATAIGVGLGTIPAVWIALWEQGRLREQGLAERRAQSAAASARKLVRLQRQLFEPEDGRPKMLASPTVTVDIATSMWDVAETLDTEAQVSTREELFREPHLYEVAFRNIAARWGVMYQSVTAFAEWKNAAEEIRYRAVDHAFAELVSQDLQVLAEVAKSWFRWDGHGSPPVEIDYSYTYLLWTLWAHEFFPPPEERAAAREWWFAQESHRCDLLLTAELAKIRGVPENSDVWFTDPDNLRFSKTDPLREFRRYLQYPLADPLRRRNNVLPKPSIQVFPGWWATDPRAGSGTSV